MQCKHAKLNGEPCQAHALPGKRCCTFHEPALKQNRAEGRKRGGVNRSRPAATLPPETPDAPLSTVDDIINLLGQTVHQVRTGQLSVNAANSIGVLSGVLLRALEERRKLKHETWLRKSGCLDEDTIRKLSL